MPIKNFFNTSSWILKLNVTVPVRAGSNTIERRSIDSSVTVPFEQTFRSLDNAPLVGEEAQNFNYCGCGWPDHMLVPRGTRDGYPCTLFVMISNFQDDRVNNFYAWEFQF